MWIYTDRRQDMYIAQALDGRCIMAKETAANTEYGPGASHVKLEVYQSMAHDEPVTELVFPLSEARDLIRAIEEVVSG